MKKQTLRLALLCLTVLAAGAPARAKDLLFLAGREDRWEGFQLDNLSRVPGRWGTPDLVLRDNEYAPTPGTDLLLHFNTPPVSGAIDESGRYRVTEARLQASERAAARGADARGADAPVALGPGAAAFTGADSGLRLQALPGKGALFERGSVWGDFSIEFWLYPALLAEGEQLLIWTGAHRRAGELMSQRLACTVQGRRLSWSFENLFLRPGSDPGPEKSSLVALRGLTPMIPRVWRHHLIRYNSTDGVLEYLVDGVPEAVTYTTTTGGKHGDLLLPLTGAARSGDLEIGPGFVGLLDELRIYRGFVETPSLRRFGGQTGAAVSFLFDLGYTQTRLKRIESVYDTPSDSAVLFFYRLWDQYPVDQNPVDQNPVDQNRASPDGGMRPGAWTPFRPGQELVGVRGRYLQIRLELFPDGMRSSTPRVSEVRVIYEQNLPPPPPTNLYAAAEDGVVHLYWNPVNQPNVLGYLVYYGEAPGNYHGTGSVLGPSPIDVGGVTNLRVTGLRNRTLYYFSVVAYDGTEPPHRSAFSKEISARPAEIHASSDAANQAVQ